jgi:uncharacterized membrane protein (UPF0127 family)
MMILKHNGMLIAGKVDLAENYYDKVLGLMFRRSIPQNYALLFMFKKPGVVGVHMLFMRFPVAAIFLDEDKKILAATVLKPWTGFKQIKNVQYLIEMNPKTIEKYGLKIGDVINFD